MILLEKADVIKINVRTINAHGGNFNPPSNFLHEENLDYLLEAIDSQLFGEFIYPTIPEKACVYFYNIICNHVFSDGNKRTGLEAGLAFLALNNFELNNVENNDLLNFVINVASGNLTLDQCKQWFIDNTIAII